MSKFLKKSLIILGIILFCTIGFIVFAMWALKDYPMVIIGMSSEANPANKFYINGEKIGNEKGFCKVNRRNNWTVELRRDGKIQQIVVWNDFNPNNRFPFSRFSIGKPEGDDLGLSVIQANAQQELRKQFGCDI